MHHTSLGEPGFVRETLKNVTVPEGRDVLLSCTVKNLDSHKVRNMKRNNLYVIFCIFTIVGFISICWLRYSYYIDSTTMSTQVMRYND